MARAVVIGANGFIGSHLVDALSAEGHDVRAFDRFSARPTFSTAGVEVMAGDFLNRADLEQAVGGQDYVLHFLSTTTPATAEGDPTFDVRTNLAQTLELLEACVAAGTRHVYFASTGGAIYGEQGHSEYRETDLTLPVSPYAIGKLTVEHYLRYFRATHGLQSTSLRISNPYGPRQRANRRQGLIPIVLRQVAAGEPVTRFGDGAMVRDFLFVDDLVRMIVAMVGLPRRHDVYNIGSGVGHSVAQVLATIREVTGTDFTVVERATPPTYVERVVLDVARYRGEFGRVEPTSLVDGIARTWLERDGAAS